MTDCLGRGLDAMSGAERYHREVLHIFAPYLGERIVDVGAGSGNFTTLLLERDPAHVYAIEPDDAYVPLLRERLNGRPNASVHHCVLSEFAEGAGGDKADSVVSVNVLEHVEDDVDELVLIRRVLRPGGYLCLWVPALPALYAPYDRALGHHRRYKRREIADKLEKAGFDVLLLNYRDLVGMLAWLVLCRILRRTPGRGAISAYDRYAMPLTRLLGRWSSPPVGKNLVGIARKPWGTSEGPPRRSTPTSRLAERAPAPSSWDARPEGQSPRSGRVQVTDKPS